MTPRCGPRSTRRSAAARAVNQDGDERTWDQLQTDAIVDHITRQHWRQRPASLGQVAEVSVLIDYTALVHGGDANGRRDLRRSATTGRGDPPVVLRRHDRARSG